MSRHRPEFDNFNGKLFSMNSLIKSIAITLTAIAITSCSLQNIDMTRASSALAKGTQALTLTNEQLAGYVGQAVAEMDATNRVAPASSPYAQRLKRLTAGITSVGDIPLNFKVYQTKEINAFACADGSVRVYSGIMDLMNDDELMGIIGHEIGHIGMEHSKKSFQQQLVNEALLDAVGSTSTKIAQLTDSQLADLGAAMMSAKFSRKQENEADDFGYEFLKYCERNPYYMVLAFEKMQALEQSGSAGSSYSSYFSKMFSSHPETSERIKHIKQLCERDGYTRP